MWFFKRKKKSQQPRQPEIACTFCRSINTNVISHHGSDQPNYIRVWRGRRYLTCRCRDCGKDFYADVPTDEIIDQVIRDDRTIDDEDALKAAENELNRQIDEENDRRFK